MIGPIVEGAYRRPWTTLAVVACVVGIGAWSFTKMQIEAYPDISGQVVQVITSFPGRAAEEVERQVTVPVERVMANVPRASVIRSRTIFGLSLVQISFEEGVELYWARERVREKLSELSLAEGTETSLGPLATAYGEVCRYELRSDGEADLTELRTANDWIAVPRLLRVPGVADVTNFGGLAKQYVITARPAELQRFGVSLADLVNAVQQNNSSAGGSVLRRGSESLVIRGKGSLQSEKDVGAIFVASLGGTPIYVRDVADVGIGTKVPSGIFSKDTRAEAVEGIVLIRKGENPSQALERIKSAVDQLNRDLLPPGVHLDVFYDRTNLVDATFHTVAHSVGMGIGLVVVVLVFFTGSPRLSLLVALTIPFSLLFALICMQLTGIPIGLLSIGAIDFGIIVDGAVIVADSIAHRLGHLPPGVDRKTVRSTILHAALEVERPVFFAVLMIVGVHLPLLTLTRIEGLLFRPMALTIVFALAGSLIFALLAVPALTALTFPNGYREWDNPVLRLSRWFYLHILRALLAARWIVAPAVFIGLLGVVAWITPRLGTEFLPYMDEGVFWVRANFPEGCSLEQTSQFGARLREIVLKEFPDVQFVSVQSGRNDAGTDPFPASRMEIMVGPKPREYWKQYTSKADLVAAMGKRFREEFPTTRFNFTQPIIDSVTEDTNGTSANLAIEFSGPDPDVLRSLGLQGVKLLKSIPGAVDVAIDQEGPQPQLLIEPDRAACARYNVSVEDVNTLINTALGGAPVGQLYEGERVFDIAIRFDGADIRSPQAIGRLPVFTHNDVPVPLSQVAKVSVRDGQTIVAREGGRRRLTVRCDIVGRDQGGFVEEAQAKFDAAIKAPEGYRVGWLGMFENLERAKTHFFALIPIAVVVIFALLIVTLGSVRAALAVLLAVPFAIIGGVLGLHLRGMNLNVSGGVGFAALFGVSIMNGVLLVQRVTALRQRGLHINTALLEAASVLFRPILMASLVAMLGLLPASTATGLGSDVQRPLATVIVWGLFGSTALTLFIVPVFYRLLEPPLPEAVEQEEQFERAH